MFKKLVVIFGSVSNKFVITLSLICWRESYIYRQQYRVSRAALFSFGVVQDVVDIHLPGCYTQSFTLLLLNLYGERTVSGVLCQYIRDGMLLLVAE